MWSTSDDSVLDIQVKGNTAKITAKGEGKAVVTATTTDGTNISDSFEVTVKDYTFKLNALKTIQDGKTALEGAEFEIRENGNFFDSFLYIVL